MRVFFFATLVEIGASNKKYPGREMQGVRVEEEKKRAETFVYPLPPPSLPAAARETKLKEGVQHPRERVRTVIASINPSLICAEHLICGAHTRSLAPIYPRHRGREPG